MSGHRNGAAPRRIVASEDCGLGYCLRCLEDYKAGTLAGLPELAITTGPIPVPVPGPGGQIVGIAAVPVPVCYDHVGGAEKPGAGLIIAAGGLS